MKKSFLAFAILQFTVVSLHVTAADLTQDNAEESAPQEPSSAISACMIKNKSVPSIIEGNLKDTYCCIAADKKSCLSNHFQFVKWVWENNKNYLDDHIANCPHPVKPIRLKPCDFRPGTIEVLSCLIDQIEIITEKINECPEAFPTPG